MGRNLEVRSGAILRYMPSISSRTMFHCLGPWCSNLENKRHHTRQKSTRHIPCEESDDEVEGSAVAIQDREGLKELLHHQTHLRVAGSDSGTSGLGGIFALQGRRLERLLLLSHHTVYLLQKLSQAVLST